MRNPTSAYKFGTLASSGFENYFKSSEELHKASLFMEKYKMLSNDQAVKAIKSG